MRAHMQETVSNPTISSWHLYGAVREPPEMKALLEAPLHEISGIA
jgi:hypothetical protein